MFKYITGILVVQIVIITNWAFIQMSLSIVVSLKEALFCGSIMVICNIIKQLLNFRVEMIQYCFIADVINIYKK